MRVQCGGVWRGACGAARTVENGVRRGSVPCVAARSEERMQCGVCSAQGAVWRSLVWGVWSVEDQRSGVQGTKGRSMPWGGACISPSPCSKRMSRHV